VQSENEDVAAEALNRVQEIAKSVRDLSHRLHPAKVHLIGLVPALQALQRELSRPGMVVAFTHDNLPSPVPPNVALCLFRVAQEGLHNALKYSGAPAVSVHLRGGPNGLVLTITDEGIGFDVNAARGKGLGLISMEERVAAIGGSLKVRSRHGSGTRLEVNVPFRSRAAPNPP
jgi:signal transduction histidine kinase